MKFLKVIQTLKLHWLCCKWRDFVSEQVMEHRKLSITMTVSNSRNDNEQSKPETREKSESNHGIEMSELSIETVTIN